MKDRRLESEDRLIHMQKAVHAIELFTRDACENDFLTDHFLSSAVLFQFGVIGEAVIHVDKSMLDKYKYPWYKVRAFRNLISHEYFNIKLEAVWVIVENDLPLLKRILETMLEDEY